MSTDSVKSTSRQGLCYGKAVLCYFDKQLAVSIINICVILDNKMAKEPSEVKVRAIPLRPIHSTEASLKPSAKNSNNIVNRVKIAVDNGLKRADELKQVIESPTSFQGFREWSASEKEELTQAENDYQEIQAAKIDMTMSLDQVGSLLDEKSLQYNQLSADINDITSKLQEIDSHLSEYEAKLKLLDEKGDDITEEEKAWLSTARKQIDKLQADKAGLGHSLSNAQALQKALNQAEKTITQDLEKFLGEPPVMVDSDQQSAKVIVDEMAKMKAGFSEFSQAIRHTCAAASQLLTDLFDSVKNISSKIVSQLKSTNDTLATSTEVLNNFPVPTIKHQLS